MRPCRWSGTEEGDKESPATALRAILLTGTLAHAQADPDPDGIGIDADLEGTQVSIAAEPARSSRADLRAGGFPVRPGAPWPIIIGRGRRGFGCRSAPRAR
jgi:hypothetical protein